MFDFRVIPVCLALFGGVVPAVAQQTQVAFGAVKADPSLPVEVNSDSLNVNQEDGSAEFVGNVVVTQGEMRLSAERVRVIYNQDKSGIQRLEASDNVVLVSPPDAAEGDRAEYSIETGVITMQGNVLLTQGVSTISSDQMVANLVDGTAVMTGRVKTILQSGAD